MELNELLVETKLDNLWKGNHPDNIYWYKNQNGEPIGGVVRSNRKLKKGGKTIRYIRKVKGVLESEDWEYGSLSAPRPLFNLPNIINNAGASVLIVEGEKTAEAAQQLFPAYVVTTTMGGANSLNKTDFAPLEGLNIIISPDNDTAGDAYMKRVITLCRQVNVASIMLLSPNIFSGYKIFNEMLVVRKESLPQGYDLADAIEEGWTVEFLKKVCDHIGDLFIEAPECNQQLLPLQITNKSEGVHANENENSDSLLPIGYALNMNGLTYNDEWLCSYINVLAQTHDEANENWGRLIELTDPDGNKHSLSISMTTLVGDINELIKRLVSLGLRMDIRLNARNKIVNFLQNAPINSRRICVSKIGWHGDYFVFPNQVEPHNEKFVLQSDIAEYDGHATAGTLQEWQAHIAILCKGNSRLLMALSAAFAAPLLSLLQYENFGLHIMGSSSIGKTTALNVANSVWGASELQESWKATANALEAVAVCHNDSLLCLDELGQADGKEVGEVVYMLANGTGKSRMKSAGDLRKKHRWKTLVISTGEVSIEDKLYEFNQKPKAGMAIRFIEIPADTESGYYLFDTIHHFKQSSDFANSLKELARRYYGTPIRRFLTIVNKNKEHLSNLHELMNLRLLSHVETTAQLSGQVRRATKHFALVALAGELAIEMGILPFDKYEAFTGIIKCFKSWLNARGDSGEQDLRAGIMQVRRFFHENNLSRFAFLGDEYREHTIPNLAGYKVNVHESGEETGVEFFVFPETFRKEICAGYDSKAILNELVRLKMLKRGNDRQIVYEKRLPHCKKKVYYFTSKILADFSENDLDLNIDGS